jgi:hypothetical protein
MTGEDWLFCDTGTGWNETAISTLPSNEDDDDIWDTGEITGKGISDTWRKICHNTRLSTWTALGLKLIKMKFRF